MNHIEFIHRDHFFFNYHRKKAGAGLAGFIDFFWETRFDELLQMQPGGFTDMLFPDVGYTYLINLGTPFAMQLDGKRYDVKTDSFLPRYTHITAQHSPGNKIFGIKFKVTPVLFQKKVNFYEYRDYVYPLAYLMENSLIAQVKSAGNFAGRVELLSRYFEQLIQQYNGYARPVEVVTATLRSFEQHRFKISIEALAGEHHISTKTLQRYFETTTGISTKQALQVMRVRSAIASYVHDSASFDPTAHGYFDYSHFYKCINSFLKGHAQAGITSHLQLLNNSGIINY